MLSLEPAIVRPVVPATTSNTKMLFVQGTRVLAIAMLEFLACRFLPLFPVGPFEVLYLIPVTATPVFVLVSSFSTTLRSAIPIAPAGRP